MSVKAPDEMSMPAPEWATIEQVFAALESPLLAYWRRLASRVWPGKAL